MGVSVCLPVAQQSHCGVYVRVLSLFLWVGWRSLTVVLAYGPTTSMDYQAFLAC